MWAYIFGAICPKKGKGQVSFFPIAPQTPCSSISQLPKAELSLEQDCDLW
jgi:hypothetical protein